MQGSPSGHAAFKAACTVLLATAISACGGGGGGRSGGSDVSGSAVKGPMANATVSIHQFSSTASSFIGAELDVGSTTARAEITGIRIPSNHTGAIIFEVIADSGTVDLASGVAPVITRFRTVVTDTQAASSGPIYPSPLTTLAYDLAVAKADSNADGFGGNNDGTTTEAEFLNAFQVASAKVASSLGFGIPTDLDLNGTPPLVTAATLSTESLSQVAAYRTAIEAISAILVNMEQAAKTTNASTTATTDSLLSALANDLGDGIIDGQANGQAIAAFADVGDVASQVNVDPATLTIPGTTISVSDVESVLVSEKQQTGVTANTDDLSDGTASADPSPASTSSDIDGDGVGDADDNCPSNANPGQADFDEDGLGNVCDSDDDNDGVSDAQDAFPRNSAETTDSDGDGVGDNSDNCPSVANAQQQNTDGDEFGNACDADDDNDGVNDAQDAFPLDPTETVDFDNDSIGNNADPDDDNDGVNDDQDAFPFDDSESADSDGDGVGDNSDAFPNNAGETVDSDNDGVGDNSDVFPNDPNESADSDADGIGDNADNCPSVSNADQADEDVDGIGDVCDGPDAAVWDSFNWDNANWQ